MKNLQKDHTAEHRPPPAEDERAHGSALAKSMAVLDLVAADGRPMGLVEVTERLGLAKPTAHRIMRQLEDEGLLRREPLRDRYGVGPRLCALSINALSCAVQCGATHVILADLVAKIGETCNIGMLDRMEVLYVDRVECDWPLRLLLAPNSRLPAYCTAIGKLLLAFLDGGTRGQLLANKTLERFTATTIADSAQLEQECRTIRDQEYATNNQEFHLGLIGLAVPIRDGNGRVVAGLAAHGPLPRLDLDDMLGHLPALREAAARMGAALMEASDVR